jgi:4-hydroxy-tetrahydrodipicolinate synthase
VTQVTQFQFGLVHAPLTPFIDGKLDLATFEKSIRFHVAAGADALAIQTHAGESVSLPVDERKTLLDLAIATAGTTPIIANVSEAGTGIACDLARHAKRAGAKAMIACVPYYWTPPDAMLVEHFAAIAEAGELPLFLYNSPHEMNNVKIKTPVVMALVGRSTFIAGLIDVSMDWQFMIEVIAEAKRIGSNFQLISGTEYMISAHATGATGLLSPVTNIAPALIRRLYDLCAQERYPEAHQAQVDAAFLYRLFDEHGVAGLKVGSKLMARDCGQARPPLPVMDGEIVDDIAREMNKVASLTQEKRGW